MNTSEDMEKRYMAALEKQLQEEKMVTFKLSQQIESLEKQNKDLSDKVTNWRESWTHMNAAIEKKDAALRAALEWLDEDEAPKLQQQIKEAL